MLLDLSADDATRFIVAHYRRAKERKKRGKKRRVFMLIYCVVYANNIYTDIRLLIQTTH